MRHICLHLAAAIACIILASIPASAELIGYEPFDYSHGSIVDQNGGLFWDFDNQATDTFGVIYVGHTGTASDWDTLSGDPEVNTDGQLVTNRSHAYREFNGGGERYNPGPEAEGGINSAELSNEKKVYVRVDYTASDFGDAAGTFGGFSFYHLPDNVDGAEETLVELIFFGRLYGTNNFGIRFSNSGIELSADETYVIVGLIDYQNDVAKLWVNPTDFTAEPVADFEVAFTDERASNGLRLASTTEVSWDNLVVATEWSDLSLPKEYPTNALGQTDTFGYSVEQVEQHSGSDYIQTDISKTGTRLTPSNQDDGYVEVALSKKFPFYGSLYDTIRVSTNGYIAMGNGPDTGDDYTNDSTLPANPTTPNDPSGLNQTTARIMPFHDDLRFNHDTEGMFIQYFPDGIRPHHFRPNVGVTVIQWETLESYAAPNKDVTFQAQLFDDGSIYFDYYRVGDFASFTPTIGIQNQDASSGLDIFSLGSEDPQVPSFFRLGIGITPPVVTVTNASGGEGSGSLRAAIANAPNPAFIRFDPSVFQGNENPNAIILSVSGVPRSLNNFYTDQVVTIDGSTVNGVSLQGDGDRIFDFTADRRVFADSLNIANGSSNGFGGGIHVVGGEMSIRNSAIIGNTASSAGGGVFVNNGNIWLYDCTIAQNDANLGGGLALRNSASEMKLIHCTVANNYGAGGFFIEQGNLTLTNSIVSNPTASDNGPRDINGNSGGSTLTLTNTIVRTRNGPFDTQLANTGSALIGTEVSPVEAGLVGDDGNDYDNSVTLNGGPTRSIMLMPDSIAVDRISADLKSHPDQRGVRRVNRADLGAVESEYNSRMDETDFLGGKYYDVTIPSLSLRSNSSDDSAKLVDNDVSTRFDSSRIANLEFENLDPLRPIIPRGIRFNGQTNTAGAYLLLGSNDQKNYELIGSANHTEGESGEITSWFKFSIYAVDFDPSANAYRYFRVIVVKNNNPFGASGGIAIEEFELLGYYPDETPEILDYEHTAPEGPNNDTFSVTFSSIPGRTYKVRGSGGALQDIEDLFDIVADEYEETTTFGSLDQNASAFVRIRLEPDAQ